MTFQRVMTGAAVAVAAICFGAALVAADRETSREFLEVTGFDVAITSMQEGAMNGLGIAGADPDAFGSEWVRLSEQVFDPDAMIEDTLDMMEAIMPQELVDHGMDFYGSELGQRLVEAENAGHGVSNERQMAEGEMIVTRLADENPDRIEEYRKMSAAIGGVEQSTRAIIEIQVRYMMAAMAAGASDIQYSEAELREILSQQSDQLANAISTSGIFSAGEKKCIPMKLALRELASANSVIGSEEVLDAKIAESAMTASVSLVTAAFTLRSSKTASITRSTSLMALYSSDGVIALRVLAIFSGVTLPSCMPLLRILAASDRPRSRAGWLMSFITTGKPFTALW